MVPRATYRLQFSKQFTFRDAAALAPYIAQLGFSHVYASPYLQSRRNSDHGYDITNHNELDCDLGGAGAFREMLSAFRENGLGHILDYVPNHMGVGGSDNPRWLDVLEWGSASRFAPWFDIDWDSHPGYLRGKLLVPFLGRQYGAELQDGKIDLKFDVERGEFSVWLYDTHKLPITPATYSQILAGDSNELKELAREFAALSGNESSPWLQASELKSRLAELVSSNESMRAALGESITSFRGTIGNLESWSLLDDLIYDQHWRPAHFRVAADDINYRRFFNISELAGIRMELPEVFAETHKLVFELLREGSLQGLRIDHIDGLFDPKEYLYRLRNEAGVPFYLIVEKIIERHEDLRSDWPVDGTTGYEFASQVASLLVDSAAEKPLSDFYREFTGEQKTFAEIVHESKLRILDNEMAGELASLTRSTLRVARLDPRTQDFTHNILRRALKEICACFPVYRTYVDASGREETDERYIRWAIAHARKNELETDPSVFDFLQNTLLGEPSARDGFAPSAETVISCAMKAQQFSGPMMAKGFEDTALFRYNRFVALNDVGSSPDEFGITVATFHKKNQQRAEKWPGTMLATSTHDTKRGEDARARLTALSLVPEEWIAKVAAWSRILRARLGDVEGSAPPASNDEYLFYQNLLATWPPELGEVAQFNCAQAAEYTDRLTQAMTKSLREARQRSSWFAPDFLYEEAVNSFVRDALNPEVSATFLENFLPFQQRIAEMGLHNSLVQLVLKLTSPGVPDFYQGSELWELSLTDPDNRRPVDFRARCARLQELKAGTSGNSSRPNFARLAKNWRDGTLKLAVLATLLEFRNKSSELFSAGAYEPIWREEDAKPKVICYRRTHGSDTCIVVASLDARLTPSDYSETLALNVPDGLPDWRDVITDRTIAARHDAVKLADLFAVLPVVVLVPEKSNVER